LGWFMAFVAKGEDRNAFTIDEETNEKMLGLIE
jgi:hypothetical protein